MRDLGGLVAGSWRAALLMAVFGMASAGCGGYGAVSPTTYEYAKALYSVTNRQASDRLDEVSSQIESARTTGEISDEEAGWLNDIVEQGRAGDWQSANQAARQIMEDQVK